jgi:APA family basic amino acid/polyamine antiporter
MKERDLPRTIGFWGASAVMVGVMIGSGIFQNPPLIARLVDSGWLVLGLWVAGGVLSLLGALTYAELATMYPQSGGLYVFLREAFGRGTAFIFGWTYMLVTKPFAAAGITVVFAQNVNALLGTQWNPAAMTCVTLVVLTGVNVLGMRMGAGVAGVLTAVKVAALLAVIGLGLVISPGGGGAGAAAAVVEGTGAAEPLGPIGPWYLAIVPAMTLVLWAYDGWSDVGAIAGEVRDPQRRLVRIYAVGTAVVVGLYVAANAVFLKVLPLEQMRGVADVAPVVMERLVGPVAGVVVTLVVVVSTVGSTHSSIITGARVTYQQARDGLLFRFLGRVHPRYGTPDTALWTQCALSCAAVLYAGTFQKLAGGFVFTMWMFYGLGGIAIFVLRVRRPAVARPYRCWGYPLTPAVFVLAAAGMTAVEIVQNPSGTLPWLGVLAAGVPVYFVWRKWAGGVTG